MLCLCKTVSPRVARVKLFRLPQLSSLPPNASLLPPSFVVPASPHRHSCEPRGVVPRRGDPPPTPVAPSMSTNPVAAIRDSVRPEPVAKGHHPATNPSLHAAPRATLPSWKRHPTRTAPPTPTMTPHRRSSLLFGPTPLSGPNVSGFSPTQNNTTPLDSNGRLPSYGQLSTVHARIQDNLAAISAPPSSSFLPLSFVIPAKAGIPRGGATAGRPIPNPSSGTTPLTRPPSPQASPLATLPQCNAKPQRQPRPTLRAMRSHAACPHRRTRAVRRTTAGIGFHPA